jgi:hypothetical protein
MIVVMFLVINGGSKTLEMTWECIDFDDNTASAYTNAIFWQAYQRLKDVYQSLHNILAQQLSECVFLWVMWHLRPFIEQVPT